MLWLFIILAVSTGAVALVGISVYLRVRRHMRKAVKETSGKE